MSALGDRFRAAREARGLSLSDVSEQIRIRAVYLGAIEDENWSAIGAPVYTKGFLRTYARFLGLDPEEAVGHFKVVSDSVAPSAQSASPGKDASWSPRPRRNLTPLIWTAGLIAVLLIAFVFYNELTMRGAAPSLAVVSPGGPPSAVPSTVPTTATSGVESGSPVEATGAAVLVSSPPAGAHSLQVSLTGMSWLRVTVDGSVSMEGTFPAGTVKMFRGKTAAVRAGNAGGVEVAVDGKSIGKLGGAGVVVERSFVL